MAGGSINEELTVLDTQMYMNFMAYAQTIMDSWRSFQGNHGQKTIMVQHLLPAAYEHIGEAAYYWPRGASASEYPEKIYGSYQTDVVERAFSDTIESIVGELEELQSEAEEWQDEHDALVAILGDSWEPHSVYPPFEGGGGMVTQPTGAGREGLPQFVQF